MQSNQTPGEFKDLLSAALSQSGLTDDLDEYADDFTGFENYGNVPVNQNFSRTPAPVAQTFQTPMQQTQNIPGSIATRQAGNARSQSSAQQVLLGGVGGRSGSPQIIFGSANSRSGSPQVISATNSRSVSPQVIQAMTPGSQGQQLRRVIIKTPQGQQQVLQRFVSNPQQGQAVTSNLIHKQVNNARSNVITLKTQPGYNAVSVNAQKVPVGLSAQTMGQQVVTTLTPQGKVQSVPRRNILNSQGSLQNIPRGIAQASPRFNTQTTPRLNVQNSGLSTGSQLILTQTGNANSVIQNIQGIPRLVNSAQTSGTLQPQVGTPKIVKVRPIISNTPNQNQVVMNSKGGSIRVIKIPKTDGNTSTPGAITHSIMSTSSTPNSTPRIVKIMHTSKESTTPGINLGAKRVIMQSFAKPSGGEAQPNTSTNTENATGNNFIDLSNISENTTVTSTTDQLSLSNIATSLNVISSVSSNVVKSSPLTILSNAESSQSQKQTVVASNGTLSTSSVITLPSVPKTVVASQLNLPQTSSVSHTPIVTTLKSDPCKPTITGVEAKDRVKLENVTGTVSITSHANNVKIITNRGINSPITTLSSVQNNTVPINKDDTAIEVIDITMDTDDKVLSDSKSINTMPSEQNTTKVQVSNDKMTNSKFQNISLTGASSYTDGPKVELCTTVSDESVKSNSDKTDSSKRDESDIINCTNNDDVTLQSVEKTTELEGTAKKNIDDTSVLETTVQKVTESSEKQETTKEPVPKETEDQSPNLGFGDLFGGDNPFFAALQQFQDTNKKAKEFEEKVKAEVEVKGDETGTNSQPSSAQKPVSSNINTIVTPIPQSSQYVNTSSTASSTTSQSNITNVPAQSGFIQLNPGYQHGTLQASIGSGQQLQTKKLNILNSDNQNFNSSSQASLINQQYTVNSGQLRPVVNSSAFTQRTPHTASITVLNQGMPINSGIHHRVQRIASPINVLGSGSKQAQQLIQVQSRDMYSPPTVVGVPGRCSESPLTILQNQRGSSPLGMISQSGGKQMFRVITQQNSAAEGGTPTVRYITTPSTQSLRTSGMMNSPNVATPLRSVQSTPRILPINSQVSSMNIKDELNRLGSKNGATSAKVTDKDIYRLWANDEVKLRNIQQEVAFTRSESPVQFFGGMRHEEEVEEEEEELGIAETYAEYMPAKLKIGNRHPDAVVESSSLSSVEPQDVYYHLEIPEDVIDCGYLSALQLETITYCSQKHQEFLPSGHRSGFLIGDGAGVGKGRTIAGIIYENYLQGRKRSIWLSVSNDLRVDAERDLRDIGASKIEVHALNKFKYAKISSGINNKVKKGIIFATYSSLIGESSAGGKYRTRFKQLIHWCGKEFDGLIVFDECHRAKNLCPVGSSKPTKTGLTVLEIQNKLPKARVVYASATGASEPRNMAYMTRLGLWGKGTPFKEFMDFIQAVEKRGVGAMELVAMDMKLRGMYIARQLSFKGVGFKIEQVPISEDFVKVYNESVKMWVEARDAFQKAAHLMGAEQRTCKTMWGQFWSSHQRFFKYLCIHAKLEHCVRIARQAIKSGKCVVIGLQSTGEARTMEALEQEGELTDFVSTAKGVFQTLVERHFPAPNRKKTFDFMSLFEDSPAPSPKLGKRKNDFNALINAKRRKEDWSDDSDTNDSNIKKDDNDSANESDMDKSDNDSDSGGSDKSDEESDDSDQDDFNPFGAGSDSDDDPWLKKAKKKKKEKKKEKKPKKSKEKTKEKKKEKDKKKKRNDSDDEFDNIDKKFDNALVAAGLRVNQPDNIPGSAPALSIGADDIDQAAKLREGLMMKIERLGDKLPPNTLDQLIDDLGGTENVAEMTGRKGRVVTTEDGSIHYESRSEQDIPLEILNLAEKQRFMDGEKLVAVISEAASSGISLQADRRAINQRRRVHITLELPWSADRAIQQFGRTHRSNQVSGPEYIFLISDLAGERRFASTVSKRLESLGALTHGDRRATDSRDLSQFNIDNKYGKAALESVMKSVMGFEPPLVPPPIKYNGHFYKDAQRALVGVGIVSFDERYGGNLEKDYNNISKFLNRILGMEVDLQNFLFQYFTETLSAICLQAKRNGRWDMGILDLGSAGETVRRIETKSFVGTFSGCKTKIELNTVSVERGTSFTEAMRIWHDHDSQDDGFYLATDERSGRRGVALAYMLQGKKQKEKGKERYFNVYKPNTGLQGKPETLGEIKKKYRKVLPDDARRWWEDQYDSSASMCSHMYWKGNCRRASLGQCEVGLRSRLYYVLSGSVLSVWTTVEKVLASTPGAFASRMQIIRLRTDDSKRIVGTLIPQNAINALTLVLSQESRIYNTQHGQSNTQISSELAHASDYLSYTGDNTATTSPFIQQPQTLTSLKLNNSQFGHMSHLKHHASSPASLMDLGNERESSMSMLSMPTSFF